MPILIERGGSVGQFQMQLDGMDPVILKSVEGGLVKGNAIEEQVGTHLEYIKHVSTVEIEPLSLEVGMQDAIPILMWIQSSWRREWCRKNGMIRHADFDYKETFQQHFSEALISEVAFPTLDAGGKEGAYLKVKIQPETVAVAQGEGHSLTAQTFHWDRQKLWNTSCFRLNLDNMPSPLHVNKIDSFTVKQGVKALYTGADRYPQWEPTKITFPDLAVHMTLQFARPVIDWYETFIMKGKRDDKAETSGSIEYLAPNKRDVVFRIKLDQVGIKGLTIDKSEKNDAAKRVKFDLYVGAMDLDGNGALALE